MRREAPEPWANAMREKGMLHGERPSFSRLAAAAREHTSSKSLTPQAVIDIVTGKTQEPADENIRALALALGRTVREVEGWIRRAPAIGEPYVPPAVADQLTRKQRQALDKLIRVMVDREDGEDHVSATTKKADDASAKPKQDDYGLASRRGRRQRTDEPGDGA